MNPAQREKADAFRALHSDGVFVLPNPWDAGSAKVLAALGFQALASTSAGFPFTLTARAENHIRGNPDLDDTITRLQAYERAGASVLYAPGLRTAAEVRTVCQAVSRPVNVLALPHFTVAELAEAGARRISVSGALAWAAVEALIAAAERMRDHGDFSALAGSTRITPMLGG